MTRLKIKYRKMEKHLKERGDFEDTGPDASRQLPPPQGRASGRGTFEITHAAGTDKVPLHYFLFSAMRHPTLLLLCAGGIYDGQQLPDLEVVF